MTGKLSVKIIAPDKILYDGEADYVGYPFEGGERGVLPGHTRLIATFSEGKIRIKNDKEEKSFPVIKGLIKINRTHLSLLIS
jgi:F-type H+-transporting ATPase subunit epsilon